MLSLRRYQQEAIDSLWDYVSRNETNPVVILPTGAGKGVLLAQIAKDVVGWNGRLVILAHVKELLAQTAENIQRLAPEIPCGIYSAGLKSRDLGYPVTVAGIQSVYQRAEELGAVDIVAIDESHRIPPDGEGMYRTFLEEARNLNPNVRLVGLTATPFRTGSGYIYGKDQLFADACFEIGVRELIRDGWLSPLKSKSTAQKIDTSRVSLRGGEFVQTELESAATESLEHVVLACMEIAAKTQDRKSVLVFAVGIKHAGMIAQYLADMDSGSVATVFGDTPSDERAATIRDFRSGTIKYLVNCEVLTTGFDAPATDCVAILRPTMSPGLFYQMVGRGFRKAEGKEDCLILDFGQNLARHGPVDQVSPSGLGGGSGKADPWKECGACFEVVRRTCDICPDCGAKFEKISRGIGHEKESQGSAILTEPEEVTEVRYSPHLKKDAPVGHPLTLRVDYLIGLRCVSEFVCLEHEGYARQKAVRWWKERSSDPVPKTVADALEIIEMKKIKEPNRLMVKREGKYLRVERCLELDYYTRQDIPF